MTRRGLGWFAASIAGWTLFGGAEPLCAGPVPRIAHTLHGTVVAVDAASRRLRVRARRLEAWMGAITSDYAVDNIKVLHEVKAGDQIMGKVYDGETALHHVEIVAIAAPAVKAG